MKTIDGWFYEFKNWPWYKGWYKFLLDTPHKIRKTIVRGLYGFHIEDTWSLDYYLNRWMPAALNTLADNLGGFPMNLVLEEDTGGPPYYNIDKHETYAELWVDMVRCMATAFELDEIIKDSLVDWEGGWGGPEIKLHQEIVDYGFELFKQFYGSLWD